ncbi:MAG: MurR/RpiR family transcriptional regulator [Tistlia sp.]|uniref:MurR/RpiR family transcriptional regulator n=1 Tax=Tistlia sp. TaxID=3057121 RepID=UPI0034A3B183
MEDLIQSIVERMGTLTPQLRRAARFVVDHPAEVAMASMRQVAAKAEVTPSTMLRLAQALGEPSYEAFRGRFQQVLRAGAGAYPDRARGLQRMGQSAREAEIAESFRGALGGNVQRAFDANPPEAFAAAAALLRKAPRSFFFGMRGCYGIVHYAYLVARMVLPQASLVSDAGGVAIDDLALARPGDCLLSVGLTPYAEATVRCTAFARERGLEVVAVTDSRASPLAPLATQLLLASTESPQFFPSMSGALATLEGLLGYLVAQGGRPQIARIEAHQPFHRQLGTFFDEERR